MTLRATPPKPIDPRAGFDVPGRTGSMAMSFLSMTAPPRQMMRAGRRSGIVMSGSGPQGAAMRLNASFAALEARPRSTGQRADGTDAAPMAFLP